MLISLLILFALAYLSLAVYVGKQAEVDTKKKSDVILVPGARSYINGKYNPCLEARVNHAVALYKDQYAPKLLFSGGDDKEDGVNEAETMRKMAIEKGVTLDAILLEKASTSTYENFAFSQKVMREHDLSSVIIVTEPFHIARTGLIARKLGIQYSQSPSEHSCWLPNKYLTKYFLKEPLAILLYKLQGKL